MIVKYGWLLSLVVFLCLISNIEYSFAEIGIKSFQKQTNEAQNLFMFKLYGITTNDINAILHDKYGNIFFPVKLENINNNDFTVSTFNCPTDNIAFVKQSNMLCFLIPKDSIPNFLEIRMQDKDFVISIMYDKRQVENIPLNETHIKIYNKVQNKTQNIPLNETHTEKTDILNRYGIKNAINSDKHTIMFFCAIVIACILFYLVKRQYKK